MIDDKILKPFYAELDSVVARLQDMGVPTAMTFDLVKRIQALIRNEGAIPVTDLFEYMSRGEYKACFKTMDPNWIIKFYSPDNETSTERYALNAAREAEVSDLFVPSFFLDLPIDLPIGEIPEEDIENYNNEIAQVSGFILQPIVKLVSSFGRVFYTEEQYERNPLPTGHSFGYALSIGSAVTVDWMRDIANTYGNEYLKKFFDFAAYLGLCDLHSNNVGYLNGKPVVIDWCSNGAETTPGLKFTTQG